MILPDLKKPFVAYRDACDIGIGAVPMQEDHLVAYVSRVLHKIETSLQVYKKELLAFIDALSTH